MPEPILIHPFDMYEVLLAPDAPEDIIVDNEKDTATVGNTVYRVTVYAPVTTVEGKKLLASMNEAEQRVLNRLSEEKHGTS